MVIYSRVILVTMTSERRVKRVNCKTWTETLANSADPDQTPLNAASDQCLHCLLKLLKLQELNGSLTSSFRTIFPACSQRQLTHQCCQCFDYSRVGGFICDLYFVIICASSLLLMVPLQGCADSQTDLNLRWERM